MGLGTDLGTALGTVLGADLTGSSSTPIPETIPGLLAWFDPAADYITKDGSNKVSAWVSREGNAYSLAQASGPAQLTWSSTGILSNPSLTCAGAEYMSGAAALAALIDGAAAHTVYAVLDLDGVAQATVFATAESTGAVVDLTRYSWAATTNYAQFNGTVAGTGTTTTATTDAIGSSPEYVGYFHDGSTVSFRVGGAAVVGGANTRAPTCDLCMIAVRRFGVSLGLYMTGKIAEIFVYDHPLTAGQATTLEGYITGKYVGI